MFLENKGYIVAELNKGRKPYIVETFRTAGEAKEYIENIRRANVDKTYVWHTYEKDMRIRDGVIINRGSN